MAKFFDENQLIPPTKPGIDPNNPVQARLIEQTNANTIDLLRGKIEDTKKELSRVRNNLEAATKELTKYRLIEIHLGKNGENDHSEVEEMATSLREIAEIFVSKYPNEDHPRVQNLIRMFTRPIEDKMEAADEVSPVIPPIR